MSRPIIESLLTYVTSGMLLKARGLSVDFTNRVITKLNAMSGEEKDELRLKIREVVRQVKPFVDEVRVLLQDKDTEE